MTLNTTISRVSYAGNGSTTAFAFSYRFLADADLVVILRVDSTGVETTQTITTNYTVSGEGDASGGTVTMIVAPASGKTLVIYRDPAITQGVDLVENDSAPAEVIEEAHDRAAMVSQRVSDRVDRATTLSEGYSGSFDPTLPNDFTADAVLKINAAGDGFENGPTAADVSGAEASATAASASASAASASETAAASSETNAATSETNAATSETNTAAEVATHAALTATHGVSGSIVGTTDAQVLTNKDIDGGTASDIKRMTIPKGTLAAITALARKQGTLLYATDEAAPYIDTGSVLTRLAAGDSNSLYGSLNDFVSTLTAAETIAANDTICVDFNESNFRLFKGDADGNPVRKNNCIGFARGAATVTPKISTYTLDAALVTSNSIETSINGRIYTTVFSSSSDATLEAIAVQIATDQDIATAVVTVVGGDQTGSDDRVITTTTNGGLTSTITGTVTLGASQAGIVVAQTQAASGQGVSVHFWGPLAGFSGLTIGDTYYVSTTSGAITNSPTDSDPQKIGTAISSTVILATTLHDAFLIPASLLFFRSHGGSSTVTTTGTATMEQYNFSSWASSPAASNSRHWSQYSDNTYNGNLYYIDGANTSAVVTLTNEKFNKSSWSAATNRTTARVMGGTLSFNSLLCVGAGSTQGGPAGSSAKIDTFNGSSWTADAATIAKDRFQCGCFTYNSKMYLVGGFANSSTYTNTVNTWDGSSVSTDTAYPLSDSAQSSSVISSSKGYCGAAPGGNTNSYVWNGSWSSSIAMPHVVNAQGGSGAAGGGSACGFNSSSSKAYINGGNTTSTTAISTSASFNGSSWGSETASSESRTNTAGGVL